MRRLVKQFTTQLSEALEIGGKANLKPSKNQINNIVITGLGGSGIGGKIATRIVADQLKIPAVINNDYTMPKFINENTYSSVVLICRSEKEPQRTDSYPSSILTDQLVNQIKKDTYLFYQNPWPEPVPNFDDSDTMYVQLGYDEGTEFHKSKTINHNGYEHVFLTNKEFFKLNKPNNELI